MTAIHKNYAIGVILTLVCLVLAFHLLPSPVYAESANSGYSSVLEDLKSDPNFDESLYPAKPTDYSLQVLQIAESMDGKLLLYVYQPSNGTKDFTASSVNISTAINDSLFYKNYKLELQSREGTFCKYLVKDFELKSDAMRYYDISSIFRPYDQTTDKGLPEHNENDINEVSFKVAKLFTAVTVDGKVSYSCIETKVIEVTDKYVGHLRYSNGFSLCPSSCLAYFIAFDTDLPIDNLYEADIYFVTQDYRYYHRTPNWAQFDPGEDTMTYEDAVEHELTLTYDTVVEHEGGGLFAKKYSWKRIEKSSEFASKEQLTDEAKADLKNKDWVLRFYEADYSFVQGSNSFTEQSTKVNDVTILRLKFETDGVVYNLGVVDNKQSPAQGQLPDNENTNEWEFPSLGNKDWGKILGTILLMIGLILIVIVLAPLIPILVKIAVWLIALPFKLVGAIVKSLKNIRRNK